jgi:hypothetical protein
MGVQQAFGAAARVVGPLWATPAFQLLGRNAPFLIAAAIMAVVSVLAWRVPRGAVSRLPSAVRTARADG